MKTLRLHLADETVLNNSILLGKPDIQMALEEWQEINKDPRMWAIFTVGQFANERIAYVDWGVIHSNGMKETPIQTISYILRKDGKVEVNRVTHP